MAIVFRAVALLLWYYSLTIDAVPSVYGVPDKVNVGENEYETRRVATLNVTVNIDTGSYVCNWLSTTPEPTRNETSFRILKDPERGSFGVYVVNSDPGSSTAPNTMFTYANERKFVVGFRCNNDRGEFRDEYIDVAVIPNDRITYTKFTDDVVAINASVVKAGDTIETIGATDLLNHTITFTMVSIPPSNSFLIESRTGRIYAAQDMVYELENRVDLYVYASDGLISVEKKIQVDIRSINNMPNITNLPASVSVSENITAGTAIYTLSIYDKDIADTHNITMNIDPATESNKFIYDATTKEVRLNTGSTLDYETIKYYNLTFDITDGKHSTGKYVLNVHVLNVNEPCYFDNPIHYVITDEGNIGSGLLTPNYAVKDYDGVDTYRYSFVNSTCNSYFQITPSTGEIRFKVNYDVDGGSYPGTVDCVVKCTDSGGLTGSTVVSMTIRDINDNDPVFNPTIYRFSVNQYTSRTTPLGQLTVTDADSGTNAQITCSGIRDFSSGGTAITSYTIDSNCNAYFLSNVGLTSGSEQRYIVNATDGGGRSGRATVIFVYEELTTTSVTTTTTTTTEAPSTLTDGEIAAIVLGTLLGAALLGLLLYFCIRWCYTGAMCGKHPCDFCRCCNDDCCRPRYDDYPPRESRQPREPRKESRMLKRDRETAEEMKYWRDDSDYDSLRTNKEEPFNWRSTGKREYPDFPFDGSQKERLSPSHVPLEIGSRGYGRVAPLEGPLAITYY